MLWLPTLSVLIEKVAVVTPPLVLRVPVPRTVAPSLNVTVPVGLPTPELEGDTVPVKVACCPNTDGFTETDTVVVVPYLKCKMTWPAAPLPPLPRVQAPP